MLIAVPSMARSATGHMRKLFLRELPEQWRARCAVFVPGDEYEKYRFALRGSGIHFIGLPPATKGIMRTRRFIGEWAAEHGHGKFVMCDDDLRFHQRAGPGNFHLRQMRPDELGAMFDWLEHALDEHAQAGVSPREGNNRVGTGSPEELLAYNTRLLRVYGYQIAIFLAHCKPDQVPEDFTMDDFHVTLSLLRAGHGNCLSYWWANDQRMSHDIGGASAYRTLASHAASAQLLVEMHPGLVRLVQKQNKSTQRGFGTRTEVNISWKKAHAEGQKNFPRGALHSVDLGLSV
jgi:hypothetical protein